MSESADREIFMKACRLDLCDLALVELRELARSRDLDWTALERLSKAEGVLPTIYQNLLLALGGDFEPMASLRMTFLGDSLGSFRAASEFVRLTTHLAAAGVPALGLKGLAVAQQLYGGVIQRPMGDLDLLVADEHAWQAFHVMTDLGYQPMLPDRMTDDQEKALIAYGEGRQLASGHEGFFSDLHWRTLDRWVDVRMSFAELWERRETLELAGGRLPTLGKEDCALILCLHGCQHGFERWKWVLDVGRAANLDQPINWNVVRERAGHRRPMVDYALILAHRLVGSALPEEGQYSNELSKLAENTEMRLRAANLASDGGILDSTIATNLLPSLSTRGRFAHLRSLATFAIPSKEDIECVSIPHRLAFLYFGVRLGHLVRKGITRVARRART